MMQNRLFKTAILFVFLLNTVVALGQKNDEKLVFTSFEVEKIEGRIDVKWTMNEAETGGYFEVERSFDGRNFKTVMYVLGQDPSIKEDIRYGGVDKFSTKRKLYYRLKQVNDSGEITFSDIKTPAIN
jgi:predicted secreted hydrolase